MQSVNKRNLSHQFDLASEQYDSRASVQAEIAQYAFKKYLKNEAERVEHGVDLGCGTGTHTQKLHAHCQSVIGFDLSMGMLRRAKQLCNDEPSHFCVADIENLPLANEQVDLIFSSMAMQWCEQPTAVVKEMYRTLNHRGKAVLAIMVDGSFASLLQSWQQLNLSSRVNEFESQKTWLQAFERYNWRIEHQVKSFYTEHDGVFDMLNSIKQVGANTKISVHSEKSHSFLSKQEICGLEQVLRSQSLNHPPFALEYRVLFVQLEKMAAEAL